MHSIYIEAAVREHPRTREILQRLPHARQIAIERYQEVFNPRQQNFRLQKQAPALILAQKYNGYVLETPTDYRIDRGTGFYFSHMMNCPYDCRYCFLQGMYPSANHVVFVNYDDFFDNIESSAAQTASGTDGRSWFFSGYDCDSLAMEPMTGFMAACLERFENIATQYDAWLEIRTKSTQIRSLLKRTPLQRCVVAYSLSPGDIAATHEHGTPSLEKRLKALVQLQNNGWPVGLRFDPILYCDNFKQQYAEFFKQCFDTLDVGSIHSVSLGSFRLPKSFYRQMVRLYPQSELLAQIGNHEGNHNTLITYPGKLEQDMLDFCAEEILRYIGNDKFWPCQNISTPALQASTAPTTAARATAAAPGSDATVAHQSNSTREATSNTMSNTAQRNGEKPHAG